MYAPLRRRRGRGAKIRARGEREGLAREYSGYTRAVSSPLDSSRAVIHAVGRRERAPLRSRAARNVTSAGGMSYRIGPRGGRIFLGEKPNAEYNIYLRRSKIVGDA